MEAVIAVAAPILFVIGLFVLAWWDSTGMEYDE